MPTPKSFGSSAVKLGRTVSSISVLAEDRLVLSEAKAPQPNHDVHDDALRVATGTSLSLG